MFGRISSPVGPTWICYVCALSSYHVIEGRQLFTLRLTTESSGSENDLQMAEVLGSFGSFVHGPTTWRAAEMQDITIGDQEFTIDDCTKDFLKITSKHERTSYLFLAQKSKSYNPF